MDRFAKQILKCAIKKTDRGNMEKSVLVSHSDFKSPRFTNSYINSVCKQLYKDGYISNACLSCDEYESIEIYLNYKGYSYFRNERKRLIQIWFPIIISLIALFKSFLPEILLLLRLIMK